MAAEVVNPTGSERVISGMKPLLLLIGVAAAIAAGVGVMLWSVGPTYSLLYSNLAAEDTAQITQSLEGAGIPYKLENGVGAISVPAEQLAAARLQARRRKACPESGGGVNAMTRDPGFGVSAFMENARYQHALETELARTIASLQNVQGARVHLAMARQSAFVSERRPGSASVFLQIKAGPPSRRRERAGHRESRGLQHSRAHGRAGDRGRSERPPAVGARDRQRHRDARQDVRVLAPPRRKLFAIASRRC